MTTPRPATPTRTGDRRRGLLPAVAALLAGGCRPQAPPAPPTAIDTAAADGRGAEAADFAPELRIDASTSAEGVTRLEIATTGTPWVHLRIGLATPHPAPPDPATVHALAILDQRFERIARGLAVASGVRPVLGRREWHAAAPPDAALRLAGRLARELAAPVRPEEFDVAVANLARRAHERCFVHAVEMAVARAAGAPVRGSETPSFAPAPPAASAVEAALEQRLAAPGAVLVVAADRRKDRRAVADRLEGIFARHPAGRGPRPATPTTSPAASPRPGGHWGGGSRSHVALVAVRRLELPTPQARAHLRLAAAQIGEHLDVRWSIRGSEAIFVYRLRPTPEVPETFPESSAARIRDELARPWSTAALAAAARRYLGARIVGAALRYEDPTALALDAYDRTADPATAATALTAEATAMLSASADEVEAFARRMLDPSASPEAWHLGHCGIPR